MRTYLVTDGYHEIFATYDKLDDAEVEARRRCSASNQTVVIAEVIVGFSPSAPTRSDVRAAKAA